MDYLVASAFITLRNEFWDKHGKPIPFVLRDKRNTQDDPFDEYLSTGVFERLPGISCIKSPGPLITPDLVLYRPESVETVAVHELTKDNFVLLAIEVKKLERTSQGTVARASGLDYNTTPPCGKVRVYDNGNNPVDIRCFYLFACIEPTNTGIQVTALALVDGDILNADFDFYLSVVGERSKEINLGTYKDGADRARPMLIFSNPLGIRDFSRDFVLIHRNPELSSTYETLVATHKIVRTTGDINAEFYCYKCAQDVPGDWHLRTLVDPFLVPERVTRTQPRGRFRLPFRIQSSEQG